MGGQNGVGGYRGSIRAKEPIASRRGRRLRHVVGQSLRSGRGWVVPALLAATWVGDGVAADNGLKVVPGKLNDIQSMDSCDDPRTGTCVNAPDIQCVENGHCPGSECKSQVETCLDIDGRIQRPGDVSLELNFRSPPLPVMVAQATEQLRRANKILCDATDGTLRIARVVYSLGESSRERSDIWWFPQAGRAFATTTDFLSDATHMEVYDYAWDGSEPDKRRTSMTGSTLAHELGHTLLGFLDDYQEWHRPRGVAFDGPPTIGAFVDGRVMARNAWNREMAALQLRDENSEVFHTMMQSGGGSAQSCAQADGTTLFQARPRSWQNFQCLTPADCQEGGYPEALPPLWHLDENSTEPEYTDCPDIPVLSSELSSKNSGVDGLQGQGLDCPTVPLPGTELVVQGIINSANYSCGEDADGDGQALDSNEECEGSQTSPCPSGTGTMVCSSCLWNRGSCSNGTECQPGESISCSELGLAGGFTVGCLGSGYWESHLCELPVEPSFAEAFESREMKQVDRQSFTDHSPLWVTEIPVRDESSDEATAYHKLWVRVTQQNSETITLEIAADTGDFAPGGVPGAAGGYHRLAVWDVTWADPAQQPTLPPESVGAVNGHEYSTDMVLDLVLGSSQNVATFMNESADPRNTVQPTGPFAHGQTTEQIVHVDLSLLMRGAMAPEAAQLAPGQYSSPYTSSIVSAYARNGVITTGERAGQDIPQRGLFWTDPGDQWACRASYNALTQRLELSGNGLQVIEAERNRLIELVDVAGQAALEANPLAVVGGPEQKVASQWERLPKYLGDKFGIDVENRDQPEPAWPAQLCPDPDFPEDFELTDQQEVVLVLDRSGSMDANVPGFNEGFNAYPQRLDLARSAARALIQFYALNAPVPLKFGLVTFNDEVQAFEPDPATPGTLRTLVAGVPANDSEVNADELASRLVDSDDPVQEANPQPYRYTGIGLALLEADQLFTPGVSRSVILVTDGEETVHPGDGTPADPKIAAGTLAAAGTQVYSIPVGSDFDRVTTDAVAGTTGGELFDARDPSELSSMMFEAAVRQQGQNLARHPNSPSEFLGNVDGVVSYANDIPVEPGSRALVTLLSPRQLNSSGGFLLSAQIVAPSGETALIADGASIAGSTLQVVGDQLFGLVRVPNPTPGTWRIVTQTFGISQSPRVSGFVDNVDHACFVGVDKRVYTQGETVRITGSAIDQNAIGTGVEMSLRVRRPDRSEVLLPMTSSDLDGGLRASFGPSLMRGRGVYEIVATCTVHPGAQTAAGEGNDPGPSNQRNADPFVREVSTSFLVNYGDVPPLPPQGSPYADDADGDGIPNAEESGDDVDGDGLLAVWDSDDDGDGTIDGSDPNSSDPNVPEVTQPEANAGSDQVIECSGAGKASATLDGSLSTGPVLPLGYAWSAPGVTLSGASAAVATGLFPVGTTTATLQVTSGSGSAMDTALVTVLDTVGPSLTVPADVYVSTCGAVNIGSASATDACGGAVQVVNNKPATFKAGVTTVTWTAVDQYGNPTSKTQRVIVGPGESAACCPSGANVIVGTSNNDTLTGTAGVDCIFGKGGQDTIKGLGGNDILSGGDGNDTIEGGDGSDLAQGGTGQDVIKGQVGADFLLGNDGDDRCYGGSQDDVIYGGQGQDQLYGEADNDSLFGEANDDRLEGGAGDDRLTGGADNDTCLGGTGNNTVVCEIIQ